VNAATPPQDRMDFATVVELLSFAVLDALPVQAPVVVTIFPERWTRLTRDCPSSSIEAIADSFLLVADTGPGSIVAIDVGPYLQQQTRVVEGDANVPGFDEQATRPGAATAPRRNRLALLPRRTRSFTSPTSPRQLRPSS